MIAGYVCSIDMLVLTEIWTSDCEEGEHKTIFKGFTNYFHTRDRSSKNPRGGIAVYIKDEFVPLILEVNLQFPETIMLSFSRALLSCDLDIILVCTYIPPEHSTVYQDEDMDALVNLESYILYESSKKNERREPR